MTIHQAKGLEWPLVVVPDLSRKPGTGTEPVLVEGGTAAVSLRAAGKAPNSALRERLKSARAEREAAESVRVLLVALTRSREHLVLSSGVPAKGGRGPWLSAILSALGEDALPEGPGEAEVPIPGDAGARLRFTRTAGGGGGRGRRPVPILERRRSRLLAGRGPGTRVPRAVREEAAAAVARVAALPPVPRDGTPYLATVSALLDFEACPLRWFWRHRAGVPDRGPPAPADAAPPDPELAAGSALVRTDGAPPPAADAAPPRREARAGDEDEDPAADGAGPAGGVPRRVAGIAVHAVLGNLDFAADDGARVRAAAAARLREELEEEPPQAAVEEVVRRVEGFRGSPLGREVAAAAGDGRLLREVPFLLKDEGVLLRGQIDLAFRDGAGRWTVADYKAGAPPRHGRGRSRYERQVTYYARALRGTPLAAMDDGLRGALVYLDPTATVVEVDAGTAALDAAGGILRRFARATAEEEFPPDRSHCRACPYGPGRLASCPEARGVR